ncbi:uncharacterized protein MELLADRAFT_85988 [Melampsora larici-populina 98AG31]|uniref:Uncharacterized protein n=1 Tax=Melampsora larici-populina (strain 98AG31 / pathotype 3-4-7) TaxID=747676 RepID=F4RKD5_MELLP|nr:uncharacterized protein MELLADRAFT_85988 [Melampsora larici-populina 98AG31]EGG07076.1 hypothetical protein MELLADRAFT_85988 [Melampsora larici-populina 98AG31]
MRPESTWTNQFLPYFPEWANLWSDSFDNFSLPSIMSSCSDRDEETLPPTASPPQSLSCQLPAPIQPTPRCSARTTPLRRQSSMIIPPSDSRKAVPSESEAESEVQAPKKSSKCPRVDSEDESATASVN